jgi:hypothetical protein
MDSIHSLQNEIGQYHNEYLWEKENNYNSIIFGILRSIKSIEKEIEQHHNKKDLWDKQHKGGKKGYSSEGILYFCDQHKIKWFGYDWKMQQFITNKNEPINFNKNIPAFVLYFNNSHIYLINDTAMRQSLLHSNDKSDIISLISKEANNNKNECENKVDIPFEEWREGENINIISQVNVS